VTHRLLALGLALAFALAPGSAASAQTRRALDDWSALHSLTAGQKIIVRTKDGDRLTGRFDSASDLLLNYVEDNGRKVSLQRESIKLVQLNRGKSRGKAALLGAAIGGGAALAIGGWAYSQGDFHPSVVYGPGALGAGIGAGIGAALGKGNKNETVYEVSEQ
jgi:hypothetical protein